MSIVWPRGLQAPVRLGAVAYLNARPLVYGLEGMPRFDLRFDLPARCAALLHERAIDVGLIPSIEYLRGGPYRIAPDLAIASRGPVASVALYTARPISEVRSIAMDTSSRTSVALVHVLCARLFKIAPAVEGRGPDLDDMLAHCDAALVIGDNALLWDAAEVGQNMRHSGIGGRRVALGGPQAGVSIGERMVEKIDLGKAWADMTGLPFVYAFWAGYPDALGAEDVMTLQRARDAGVARPDEIAREYFAAAPEHREIGARYLRDNIDYDFGDEERAGLELFYRYAAEIGVAPGAAELRFYHA